MRGGGGGGSFLVLCPLLPGLPLPAPPEVPWVLLLLSTLLQPLLLLLLFCSLLLLLLLLQGLLQGLLLGPWLWPLAWTGPRSSPLLPPSRPCVGAPGSTRDTRLHQGLQAPPDSHHRLADPAWITGATSIRFTYENLLRSFIKLVSLVV